MKNFSKKLNIEIGDSDLRFELLSVDSQMLSMNVFVQDFNLCSRDNSYYIFSVANQVRSSINYLVKIENWFLHQADIGGSSVEDALKNMIRVLPGNDLVKYSILDWGPPLQSCQSYLIPYENFLYLGAIPLSEGLPDYENTVFSKFNRFRSIQKLIVLQSHLMELVQSCIEN